MVTIHRVKVLAKREDQYSLFVFKDLESNELIMCTKLPNWNMPNLEVGEIGFIKLEKVSAGENFYNPDDGSEGTYRYNNVYLHNFVRESDIMESNIIL